MTVEYIRYRIAAEQQPAFLEAIRRAHELLAAAPDCHRYQLAHCEEEAELFI
jgi:quinol monooxygenase YgiN